MPAMPLPPLNVHCQAGYEKDIVDVRWSRPTDLQANSRFSIVGVNVYRSFDSEYGPYFRLNNVPVGCEFWRDRTRVSVAMLEDVTRSFTARGAATDPAGRYMFRTVHRPIVITPTPGVEDCTNLNVQVTVNGVPAFVESIFAADGAVELRRTPTFDVASQKQIPPVLPTSPDDVVLASYRYYSERIRTGQDRHVFYRVTTVAVDPATGELLETPLQRASQSDNREVEKADWIWTEAIRRNKWLRVQGGERVKLYIRKTVGPVCGCYSNTHRQARSDCLTCFATGVIGGYDGPFEITIAPDDGSVNIQQDTRGRTKSHLYDTWTGPSPLISQRDFILKQDGDRYGVGPVRRPMNRGIRLQQFFPISSLDHSDIRYMVPVFDPDTLVAPQTRYLDPQGGKSFPMITEKSTIPSEREIWSTTIAGENIKY